jgi:NADP-dependent 3-hydroxy acid dehydrogenase YdfG
MLLSVADCIAYSAAKAALSDIFENLRLQNYSSMVNFVVFQPGCI